MILRILGTDPILEDVLQLERIVPELCFCRCRILLVEVENLLFEFRCNLYGLICSAYIIKTWP